MRTVNQIILDAKDGKIPSHEECFYTMLAINSKLHFYHRDLMAIAESFEKGKVTGISVALRASSQEKLMEDRMRFSKSDPLKWLGKTGDPFSEKHKMWQDLGNKILENALKRNKNLK